MLIEYRKQMIKNVQSLPTNANDEILVASSHTGGSGLSDTLEQKTMTGSG